MGGSGAWQARICNIVHIGDHIKRLSGFNCRWRTADRGLHALDHGQRRRAETFERGKQGIEGYTLVTFGTLGLDLPDTFKAKPSNLLTKVS